MRVVKVLLGLAVLWSLWWAGAGYVARAGIAGWFQDQQDRGWQAEYAGLATGGYPLRHVTRLDNPVLADPATGVAWRADWLTLESPAARPGRQLVRFPQSDQLLSYFDQTLALQAQAMQADLHVAPAARFQLQRLALTSGSWAVTGPAGPLLSGDGVQAIMQQDAEQPETYAIRADLSGLTLDAAARATIRLPGNIPDQAEALTLDMTVTFSRPWDMTAITDSRPQPRRIKLSLAELRWGTLELLAAGQLEMDANGTPTGTLTVKAENWREMLSIASASGALPDALSAPLEQTLAALSRIGGNPNALDLTLSFRKGRVFAGLLPLGPAPRILLR